MSRVQRIDVIIVFAVAVISTFMVASQYYMTTLREKDLEVVSGRVNSIIQDEYRHYRAVDDRITICIDGSPEAFYFFDNRSDIFSCVMSNIHAGDIITLLHRTKLQSRIGSGSQYKIMEIRKGHSVVYSFDRAKETFSHVARFGVYTSIGVWLLYSLLRYQSRRQEVQPAT